MIHRVLARSFVESVGTYGTALEYGLRAKHLLSGTIDGAVQEQIELADTMASQTQPVAEAENAATLFAAQSDLVTNMAAQLILSAIKLVKLQQRMTGQGIVMIEEALHTFSPAALKAIVSKAP